MLNGQIFKQCGQKILRHSLLESQTFLRKYKSHFGIDPEQTALLCMYVSPRMPSSVMPQHLLFALLFLKLYDSTDVLASMCQVDEKTYTKWFWPVIDTLSKLNIIQKKKRFNGSSFLGCWATVDGTDCQIYEPSPFSPEFYSHKFKKSGLRYEIAVSLAGEIVFVNGPFAAGTFSDIKIFRTHLRSMLGTNERIIGDKAYTDMKCINPRMLGGEDAEVAKRYRARHEIINSHLKKWGCLNRRFRHRLEKHGSCFHAVAQIVQLTFEDDPIFERRTI